MQVKPEGMNWSSAVLALALIAVAMSLYACIMLSTDPKVLIATLMLFGLLQLAQIVLDHQSFSQSRLVFEIFLLIVVILSAWASYGSNFSSDSGYMDLLILCLIISKAKSFTAVN